MAAATVGQPARNLSRVGDAVDRRGRLVESSVFAILASASAPLSPITRRVGKVYHGHFNVIAIADAHRDLKAEDLAAVNRHDLNLLV
jgi:hypothetical protein